MQRKTKTKTKRIVAGAIACALTAAIGLGGTLAYLTDTDQATNTFTHGNVKIELLEANFPGNESDDVKNLVPCAEVAKDPVVSNIGTNDAYTFIVMDSPIENIALSDAAGVPQAMKLQEVFNFKQEADEIGTHENNFNSNWIELTSKESCVKYAADGTITQFAKEDVESVHALLGEGERVAYRYVFAYNTDIEGTTTHDGDTGETATAALFDKVQVANYLDGEPADIQNIVINAYAIQASDIILSDGETADWTALADKEEIYDIFVNQRSLALADEEIIYSVLNGAEQTIEKGKPAMVRSSAPISRLNSVTVDGTTLTPEDALGQGGDYVATEGSTIITFDPDFLDTLDDGEHTVEIVSDTVDGEDTQTVSAAFIVCSAKAILGKNGNLNFLYDAATYEVGQTYTDNLGSTEIVAVYDVPENTTDSSDIPWIGTSANNYREDITSANFDASFKTFKPTSTAYWFYEDEYINNITCAENLNVSKVTNMRDMFYSAGFSATTFNIGDLSKWNVSNVTDMREMFGWAGCLATTWNIGNLDKWNVSNVTDMNGMFCCAGGNATTFNIGDLSKWNVSNVTDMSRMFGTAGRLAETFNIGDLSDWDVSNVTDMNSMFSSAGYNAETFNIGDLSKWNVSKVTNMRDMFASAGYNAETFNIGDLNKWNVSNVTNMIHMFWSAGYSATTWNIGDLSKWNVSNVTDMGDMLNSAGYSATTFDIGDLDNWDVSNVTDMNSMFYSAGYSATTFNIGDLNKWNVSNVTNMYAMFTYAGYVAGYTPPTWYVE